MIALLLLTIVPLGGSVREHFDQIEIQDFYSYVEVTADQWGNTANVPKLTFTQIIFRRWNGEEHVIEAWKMLKPGMEPAFVSSKGVFEIRFMDGDKERVITTRSMVYSSSDVDSEIFEQAKWPKWWRRELRKGGR